MDGVQIAQLLLIPFVENSFKHGAANAVGPLHVHLFIEISENELYFYIENSKSQTKQLAEYERSGTGLENARRRLDLLYAGKYTLEIEDEQDLYKVNLHLQLGSA